MSLGGAITASMPREAPMMRDALVIKSVTYTPASIPAMFDDVSSTGAISILDSQGIPASDIWR